MSNTAELLDRVLAAAPDIDHALELAERLGWRLLRVDYSGAYWVMMRGPVGPCVSLLQHKPEVRHDHRHANATFRSLYGAIVLALVRGLAGALEMDATVSGFAPTSRQPEASEQQELFA